MTRIIGCDECNGFEEVQGLLQELFTNQDLIETKVEQLEKKVTGMTKKKKKDDGFINTKMFVVWAALLFVLSLAYCAYGVVERITYDSVSNPVLLERMLTGRLGIAGNKYTFANGLTIDNSTNHAFEWNEKSEELIWTFATNAINLSSGSGVVTMDFGSIVTKHDEILLDPVADAVNTDDGTIYYDTAHKFYGRVNGVWVDLGAAAAGNTLDGAYNAGNTIDVDTNPIVMTTGGSDNNRVLDLVQNDTTNNPIVLQLTNTGAGDTLQFVSTGGKDIDGSGSTWSITSAGAITATGISVGVSGLVVLSDITLESADVIGNTVATEIRFSEPGREDFIFDLDAGTNAIGLKSTTGVVELAMGAVDDLTGVGTIAFDAAASTITLASDGNNQDLTIQVTGGNNVTLLLKSTGTAADALTMATSAGGMDITVAGAAGSEDLDILSNTSITLTSTQAAADAVKINCSDNAGGIDIDTGATIDIDLSQAGADFDVFSTGGSIYLKGGQADAKAIWLYASNASGGIDIDAGTGDIDIDVIGGEFLVDITGSSKDIKFTSAAGSITLAGAEAVANAIVIDASTDAGGGIDIDFGTGNLVIVGNTAGADMTIDCDLFSIDGTGSANISVTGGGSEDLTISQLGGNVDNSLHFSSTGNAADALTITTLTNGGGIDILADGDTGGNGDIDITNTNGSIILTSGESAVEAIYLHANTGTAETIRIHADLGDTATSIDIDSDDGGITLVTGTDDAIVLNPGTGGIDCSGKFFTSYKLEVTDDIDNDTLVGTQSGGVFTNQGDSDNQVYTLPDAVVGLVFTFLDVEASGNADLYIRAASGDTIAGGVANQYYACKTDAVSQSVTLIAISVTEWIVAAEVGTWVADDTPD